MYEVELKFPVADPAALERRLAALEPRFQAPLDQVDLYFAHPGRDFARTDEALRLRRCGGDVVITWKGPKIDGATKTRRELELALAPAAPLADGRQGGEATLARWTELLEALGFRPVRSVTKRRRPALVVRGDVEVEVAIDEVAGLGTFVELELKAGPEGLDRARATLTALARELGCGAAERRSYLELLLARG